MENDLSLKGYSYNLPEEKIAQHPAEKRDNSKLLVLHVGANEVTHQYFSDIAGLIKPEDMLVVNNTQVFPARLLGQKETGGRAEIFLLNFPASEKRKDSIAKATALIKSSKRPKPGSVITINRSLSCTVLELLDGGKALLQINYNHDLSKTLQMSGQIPLPPYITRENGCTAEDAIRYQTVYASETGAVAAPTARLHFTKELMVKIEQQGTLTGHITLHVGYGTFAPRGLRK